MTSVLIDQIKYSLQDLEKDLWLRLLNGSLRSKASFHTGQIATLGNEWPEIRTVVLRKVDTTNHRLFFHTDNRSSKWEQMQQSPRLSWHFYCDSCRIQMRMKTTATLHHQNLLTLEKWQQTPLQSRKNYMSAQPPGTTVAIPSDGLPSSEIFKDLPLSATESAYSNFSVVETQVLELDWLWLNQAGQRRAVFKYNDGVLNDAQWILP